MPADSEVMEPVAVLVQVKAKPGHPADVKREVTALFERISREEPACSYIVGHQSADDPTQFMYFEQWRDRTEFEQFREGRPYMQEYFERMEEHVVQGSFSLWTQFTGAPDVR